MIEQLIAPLLISIYGDSTIWGLEFVEGKYKVTDQTAPVVLQMLYGDRAKVSSQAKIGATIKDLINGTGWFTQPFAQAIKADPGQIIIENFAINDSMLYDQQSYENYLQQFINIVRSNGKTPVLEEPNPICGNIPWMNNLAKFTNSIDKIAMLNNVTVIQEYHYIAMYVNGWQYMEGDCIHPNDTLYAMKAGVEYVALEGIHK